MALRKSSVLTGLFALGFSCWVTALGLGELTLHSALDEPFNAEIELVNIGDADENQIFVALASQEDFERAGVAWEFHLLDLKFKTDLSDAEHPVVKVSSKQSIKEPYLDFVAQLEWPSGRLLREYTLFLDLPVFDTNKSTLTTETAVSSPAPKKASSTPKKTSRQPAQQSTRQSNVPAATSTGGSAQYRVKGGDTLWKVATRTELESTTVQQRMVAIHTANPSAFVNGNANLLKKGAVLRMPELASVKLINQQQANQVVSEQSRAWNEGQQQSAVRELIGDVPAATEKEKAALADGLLRLSTPTETSTSNAQVLGRTADSEGGSASSEVLQNELGIAQEELDRSKRENLELKAKLAGLEAQLSTTSKLLELENDELKAVQLGVAADQESDQVSSEVDASAAAAVETAPVVSDSPGVGDKGPITEAPVKGPLSGLFAFLQSNWMPLLGLVVVLLGVLLLVAKSKKDDQPEQVEPFLSPDIDTDTAEQDSSFEAEEPKVDAEPAFSEPESDAVAPVDMIEEVDPIGEADIYLSLGNFSEAESVIETAIAAAPNDSKLHLKRLDLFAAQQDAKGFDAYYPTLVALGDEAATSTADRLRGNIQEEVFEEPVEETRELTLEEQVAEELGIEGLELDLSDMAEPQADTADEFVAELDELVLDSDLENSFVDSDESGADVEELLADLNEADAEPDLSEIELDLSEIELDLKPAPAAQASASASEASDEDLDDALFGDISLPDELDDLSTEIEIDLPDLESDELELPELASDEIELPDLANVELQDAQLESEDDTGLELSLDSFDFDSDDDLDLEVGEDESNTQLELAQAYVEMGDESGAKDILAEVLNNGSDEQKQQANELLAKLS
mgnify:CR=1 FL=1